MSRAIGTIHAQHMSGTATSDARRTRRSWRAMDSSKAMDSLVDRLDILPYAFRP
jgi:hypothetical protein